MKPYSVCQKLIISGSVIEHFCYEKPYWVGFPRFVSNKARFAHFRLSRPQEVIREDNVKRTRQRIRRLVNCNSDLTKFLTLTFASNICDIAQANTFFNQFIKRLSRLYPNLKYLAIPEYQKRGAVHYHILLNLPFVPVKDLENIWGLGFIFINRIENVDNVGAYVCKYLGKENFDSRFFHKKKFFRSSNLLLPVVVDNFRDVLSFLSYFSPISMLQKFSFSFFTKWLGVVQYNQYWVYD